VKRLYNKYPINAKANTPRPNTIPPTNTPPGKGAGALLFAIFDDDPQLLSILQAEFTKDTHCEAELHHPQMSVCSEQTVQLEIPEQEQPDMAVQSLLN